ncbi:hypothetical protein WLX74_02760, partial [Bordetella bronchiseptica]
MARTTTGACATCRPCASSTCHWAPWRRSRAACAAIVLMPEVEFYYPVAVGGPITKIVDDMVADF